LQHNPPNRDQFDVGDKRRFGPILLKKSGMTGRCNFFASQVRFSERDVGDLIIRY
jgi:hypothetical protein